MPLEADVAKPALVHVYDVAEGEQLTVSVVEPPRLMVDGEADRVQVGGWFTVTDAEATAPVPAALVPVTV